MKRLSRAVNHLVLFRYYSADSVCIPRLFVTRDDNAWGLSLAITIFNFLAFTYVACAYAVILWVSRKTMMKAGTSGSSRATTKDKSKSNCINFVLNLTEHLYEYTYGIKLL